MLNEKEKKRVLKQCLFPSIALASVIVAIGIGFVWLFFVMIDDLFLNAEGFYTFGMYVYIGIVIVFMIMFCYCILSLKLGKKNRAFWDSIVHKVNATQFNENHMGKVTASVGLSAAGKVMHQSDNKTVQNLGAASQIAGAAVAIDAAADVSLEQLRNGYEVAEAAGIKVPRAKKYVALIIMLPILLLTAVYIPEWTHTYNTWQTYAQQASGNVYKLQKAFEENYKDVSADDPLEKIDESYTVTGYSEGYGLEHPRDYIIVTLNKEGKVNDIFYYKEVDINLTK